MTIKVILNYTNDKARGLKWLLGKKYGKRKSLEALIKLAANDIALEEAKKEVEESLKRI